MIFDVLNWIEFFKIISSRISLFFSWELFFHCNVNLNKNEKKTEEQTFETLL